MFDAHHISNDPGTYASGDFGIFGLEFFDDSTGDWMWFYTTQTEKDRFVRNGLGTVQYVQGWGTIGSGWSVCQFGQATNPTGFLCNTARGVVSNADGAPVRELDNDNLNNGDSGGPVWYGSTAYGIHFGDPTGVAEAYTELATVRDTSSGNIQFNFE